MENPLLGKLILLKLPLPPDAQTEVKKFFRVPTPTALLIKDLKFSRGSALGRMSHFVQKYGDFLSVEGRQLGLHHIRNGRHLVCYNHGCKAIYLYEKGEPKPF